MAITRALRIAVGTATLVATGLLIGLPDTPAIGGGGEPESPGQAALALECPDGDRQIIGEATLDATPPRSAPTPREAVRRFLRRHFPGLLRLRFVTVARRAEEQQLVAVRDGRRVASVLLLRGPAGARTEGAAACESLVDGG